jgi:hypothetical protein
MCDSRSGSDSEEVEEEEEQPEAPPLIDKASKANAQPSIAGG